MRVRRRNSLNWPSAFTLSRSGVRTPYHPPSASKILFRYMTKGPMACFWIPFLFLQVFCWILGCPQWKPWYKIAWCLLSWGVAQLVRARLCHAGGRGLSPVTPANIFRESIWRARHTLWTFWHHHDWWFIEHFNAQESYQKFAIRIAS